MGLRDTAHSARFLLQSAGLSPSQGASAGFGLVRMIPVSRGGQLGPWASVSSAEDAGHGGELPAPGRPWV